MKKTSFEFYLDAYTKAGYPPIVVEDSERKYMITFIGKDYINAYEFWKDSGNHVFRAHKKKKTYNDSKGRFFKKGSEKIYF